MLPRLVVLLIFLLSSCPCPEALSPPPAQITYIYYIHNKSLLIIITHCLQIFSLFLLFLFVSLHLFFLFYFTKSNAWV